MKRLKKNFIKHSHKKLLSTLLGVELISNKHFKLKITAFSKWSGWKIAGI